MQVQLRLSFEQAAALDELRCQDGPEGLPRSETIRQILADHLKATGYLK